MNSTGSGGLGETSDANGRDGNTRPAAVQSFVVRAFLDHLGGRRAGEWHGVVTHTGTGERHPWRRSSDVARFIDQWLAAPPGTVPGASATPGAALMVAPAFADVVTDMLAELEARLPPMPAGLPDNNVTLEQITQRLVGLGNHRGSEFSDPLGVRTLRGGRLSGRVRFQIWAASATAVDDAVLTLHSDMLEDAERLRKEGFLRMACAETTLAEPVDSVNGWRKATSYDVLYEYTYDDSDDADSLIVTIPVTLDPERAGSPGREHQTISDEMVRWDEEGAGPLVITGPVTVRRISALRFEPGLPIGGSVLVAKTTSGSPAATHLPNLGSFLAATGGESPSHETADVTLTPADLFTQIGPAGTTLDLGDLDIDGLPDTYTAFDQLLVDPIRLNSAADQLSIAYTPPPGPATGLDQTAVVYLRVNAP